MDKWTWLRKMSTFSLANGENNPRKVEGRLWSRKSKKWIRNDLNVENDIRESRESRIQCEVNFFHNYLCNEALYLRNLYYIARDGIFS